MIGLLARLRRSRPFRWLQYVRQPPAATGASAPWRIGCRGWGRIYARALDGAMRDDFGIVASSIASAGLLALLPLLSFVALVYSPLLPAEAVSANVTMLVSVLPTAPSSSCGRG